MTLSFGIGMVAGLFAVFVVLAVMKKKKPQKCEYDERQIAARRTAFKAGFITFVICELVVLFAEIILQEALVIITPGFLNLLIILISCFVFVEVSIFSDAYFTPNSPCSKRWIITMTLLGILGIIQAVRKNEDWYKFINLASGIFILLIVASIGIKQIVSKKFEKSEEEE